MKKMLIMLAVGAVVATASADLTDFKWDLGASPAPAGDTVFTVLETSGTELLSLVGGQIDIALLPAVYNETALVLVPFGPAAGKWGTNQIKGDNSALGNVFAFVGNSTVAVGDFITVTALAGPVVDLQPDPGLPANSGQKFEPVVLGQVEVIPEPATFGLMGVAALGLFLARKKARR